MINFEELKSKIREIVVPIIEGAGAYLVDINFKGIGRNLTLEIFVDTDDGITVKKCEEISRQISDALDFYDPIPGRYRLEVSSPGVGTPFKVKRQYLTNTGRFLRVKYIDQSSGQTIEIMGKLVYADDEKVKIEIRDEKNPLVLTYEQIIEAKTEIVW